MTQTISPVSLDKFVHALNHARRRFPLVDANVHHEGTLSVRVADEFRRKYPGLESTAAPYRSIARRAKEQEFYDKHCKLRLVYETGHDHHIEGSSVVGGYCVLDGELMCFWNVTKGKGLWMLDHAIADGAKFLDHFDHPHLNQLYESRGFTERLREPNDPKQRPTGGPDVIFRRREGN